MNLEVGKQVKILSTGSYARALGLDTKIGTITRVITEVDETHDDDVLPMFEVDIEGDIYEFWPDEIGVVVD